MFGFTIPPGVDTVRVLALSGKKGSPPCLWEGAPSTEQTAIDDHIASNERIVSWFEKNGLIQQGTVTVNLQIDLYSQNKRIETLNVQSATFIVIKHKKKKHVGDEVSLRAFDLTENMMGMIRSLLEERETIIGRLVERGINHKEPVQAPVVAEEPKQDIMSQFLEKGGQFMQMAKMFRELKDDK